MDKVYNHYGNIESAKRYCKDDISLIENYEAMLADTTHMWCCHHILEIEEHKTKKQLIAEGRYYKVPATELIFMTVSDHMKLHAENMSDEHRQKNSEARTGTTLSEATKRKISESLKGKHWWNNGEKQVFCKECPEGYEPGKLRKKYCYQSSVSRV